MKKFRFLTSLTLASAIISGTVGISLAAGNTAWTGVLKQGTLTNVNDKDVSGYLLTDSTDTVTVEDILREGKYKSVKLNGNNIAAATSDTVKTGDYYTAGNKTEKRHIVVYNDANQDGSVSIADATTAVNMLLENVEYSTLQKEAADVKHDGNITIEDATRIVNFFLGNVETPVDPAPKGVEDVNELSYDITVNGGATVNAENLDSSDVTLKLKAGSVKDPNTTLKLVYVDKDNAEQTINNNISIDQYATQKDLANVDLSALLEGAEEQNVVNKKVTLRLYQGTELVGETEVIINTHRPEAVEIFTSRNGSYGAKLNFKGYEDSNIVKAYYKIDNLPEAQKQLSYMFEDADGDGKEEPKAGVKVLENLKNAYAGDIELTSDAGAVVYLVVEDANGNRSASVYSTVVTKANGVTQAHPAKGADEEDYKNKVKVDANLTASWKKSDENSSKYIVRVYDESGKLLQEIDNVGAETCDVSEKITKAGKYTVEVVVKGDENKTNSEPIKSDKFEVKKLAKVTNITFEANATDPTMAKVKWTDPEHKNDKAVNYNVKIEYFDGEDWQDAPNGVINSSGCEKQVAITDREVTLNNIAANTLYRATITVLAENYPNTQKVVQSSDPETSETNYFVIGTDVISVGTATNNSITLNVDQDGLKKLGNRNYTYEVAIYESIDPSKPYTDTTSEKRTVVPDKDGNLVIDNLKQGTEYVFVVKMTSGNVVGESLRTAEALKSSTKYTAPVVKGTILDSTKNDAKEQALKDSSKIYYKASDPTEGNKETLVVNGEKYDLSKDYYDPDGLLTIAKALIPQLDENDVINSIGKETVEVTGYRDETGKDTPISLNLTSTPIKTLKLNGNIYNRTIQKLQGVETLELVNGEFNINGLLSASDSGLVIKLGEGAHVINATTVTLDKGAHTKVNGIAIYAKNGTVLTAGSGTLAFDPSGDNEINIENTAEESAAIEVTFNGNAKLGQKQLGSITITSNAGVTVKTNHSTGARVDAQLTVKTVNGDVNIQDDGLAGDVNVTVSNNTNASGNKITAYAKTEAPFDMTGLEVREYTDVELKEGITQISGYDKTSEEDIAEIQEYLKAFKSIWGKGITLTVKETDKTLELVVPKGVTVEISDSDILGVIPQ